MSFTPAGRLFHEIIIEQVTGQTQTPSGATVPVWTAIDETYAEVKPLHGRNVEIALARTKGRTVSHQITMRYVDGIDITPSTTRINFHDRYFEIFQAVNVLERNIEWDILCNEVVS
jgi:head-tail adaptor